MDIESLDVPDRVKRALKNFGIGTVEQICSLSAAELDRTPDLGRTGQKRLVSAVLAAGYPGPQVYRNGQLVKPRIRVAMGRA